MSDKIINRNYGSIQHLPMSKMISDQDKLLPIREVEWLTVKTRVPSDVVIVTEKVDGCNVGVLRNKRKLYPIIRKGYDVRTNPYEWIREFADFVEVNKDRFVKLLNDGERVCGEWMVKTHTLSYNMKHEPLICFDLINGSYRDSYLNAKHRLEANGFVTAGLVHYGSAIPIEYATKMLGSGFHGALNEPEGVVYRYENKETGYVFSGKFVSNHLVGENDLFHKNIDDESLRNKYRYWN